jgi:hypothetical protein
METIIQTIVIIFIFALAVWYLYRRFKGIADPNHSSCGCGGCGGCSEEPKMTPKIEKIDE